MNKLITLLACLVVSSVSNAATGTTTASFDKDPDILLASNDKTWSYAAYKSNGLANVRAFTTWAKAVSSKLTTWSIAATKQWPCQDFKFWWVMTQRPWVIKPQSLRHCLFTSLSLTTI